MKSISLFFVLLFTLSNCQKNELPSNERSNCLDRKIIEYKNSDLPCETGKSIYRYTFQGKYVYVFNPGNCGADMMSDVYNENCDQICGLGGIAGNLMCNGENFWNEAIDETLIWKN
jgi:hypothetical protein